MAFKFNALSGKFDIVDGAGISQATADTRYLQLSGGTMTGAINSLSVIPTVDSASDLGSSSKYFANEYVDKIYLNGTAYLDGASVGVVTVSDGLTVTGTITTNTSGNIKATGGFVYARGIFDESTTTAGIYMGYGPSNDSPRFLLANGTANQNFQIDNNAGTMRFFSPSNVIMQLSTTNIIANKPISTPSNTNLSLVPNGTGYTIIGDAGTTSHSFNTNDDLLVSGRLEVNGITYLDGVTTHGGVVASDTDSTDDLGTSSIYWANTYTDKLYLNATATLDGATGGLITATGDVKVVGTGATSATSALKIFKSDGTSWIANFRNNNTVAINAESDPDNWAILYVNGGVRYDDDFRFKKGSGSQYISRSGGTGYDLVFQCGGDNLVLYGNGGVRLADTGKSIGFYGTTPIAKQTGVAVSAAGIHAALVALGLIAS